MNRPQADTPDPQRRPSFQNYLHRRLGPPGRARWARFFLHPFAAASFAEFWRRWNPVYGYFLAYHVYRPAVRHLPRPVAVMVTFVFAGLIGHDLPAWVVARRVLPPGGTIAFTFFGAGLITSQRLGMNLSAKPAGVRIVANMTYLASCTGLMLVIVRRLARR